MHTTFRSLVAALVCALVCAGVSQAAPPAGEVRVQGHTIVDGGGPFLGLGVTYMQALRDCKYDRPKLERNLKFLSAQGFRYIRALSMVGWYDYWEGKEIAPVTFTSRNGKRVAAWPDYSKRLAELIDTAYDRYGMRTQVTIFADAQLIPNKADRVRHMDGVLRVVAGRERKVMFLEVANEAWQNGFPGDEGIADLREFGAYLAARTSVPVALTDSEGSDLAGIRRLYRRSAADLVTEHFSRDIGTPEGGWLPVRACWEFGGAIGLPPAVSNEPIGPGASVASENDPVKLVSAAAFAWTAGLPMYVFHSAAGVRGDGPFEEVPGIRCFRPILRLLPPDLPGWRRSEGKEPSAPFSAYSGGEKDRYWTEVPGAADGCSTYISASKGREFVALVIGVIDGGVSLEAHRPMKVRAYDPLTGRPATRETTLRAGETMKLARGAGAYIIKGAETGL